MAIVRPDELTPSCGHHGWIRFNFMERPPSTNNLFRNAGKRRVKTHAYQRWLAAEAFSLRRQRQMAGGLLTLGGGVDLAILCSRGDASRRQDLDNRAKAAIDALVVARVLADDSHVESLYMRWMRDDEGLAAVVYVR